MEHDIKIAIPLTGERVAHRLDCAESILWITFRDGLIVYKKKSKYPFEQCRFSIQHFLDYGVRALICGALEKHMVYKLSVHGITVFQWVTADADDAVVAFQKGELSPFMIIEPGGRKRGSWSGKNNRDYDVQDTTAIYRSQGRGRRKGRRGNE
ncbi:MAG: hypothetical protein HQK83_01910 [Fibrobacteria bacterium]|nr:hypothetical protein [Fibrobacteria bacterium]